MSHPAQTPRKGCHGLRRLRRSNPHATSAPSDWSRSVALIVKGFSHSARLRFLIDLAALFACNAAMNELDRLSLLAQVVRRASSRDWNWLYWLISITGFLWIALSIWMQSKDPEGYDQRQIERARDRIDWEASGPYR